ncbi:hypothetical protein D3C81_1468010 [compost metagenome]
MHAGAAGADHRSDHIHVAGATFHALLVLHPTQQRDLVTQLGGTLEVEGGGGRLHGATQFVGQHIAAPLEEQHRTTHVLGVLLAVDQADARPLAALDLVLQAWPGAIPEIAVLALAHLEGLLQQVEALADRQATGVRTEIAPLLLLRATVDTQARIFVRAGQEHVGIGLIVAQQDVVRRPPLLDQRLLQQQRLGLVGGDGGLDLRDARHQRSGLRRQPALAEVAGQAFLQIVGLADIQQAGLGIEHPVHARASAAGGKKAAAVEHGAHLSCRLRPCHGESPARPARHRW